MRQLLVLLVLFLLTSCIPYKAIEKATLENQKLYEKARAEMKAELRAEIKAEEKAIK